MPRAFLMGYCFSPLKYKTVIAQDSLAVIVRTLFDKLAETVTPLPATLLKLTVTGDPANHPR